MIKVHFVVLRTWVRGVGAEGAKVGASVFQYEENICGKMRTIVAYSSYSSVWDFHKICIHMAQVSLTSTFSHTSPPGLWVK